MLLVPVVAVGCGDDGDGDSGTSTSGGSSTGEEASSTMSPTTGPGTTGTAESGTTDPATSGGSSSTGSADETGTTGNAEGDSSSTGSETGPVVLQNDAWRDGATVAVQEGFATGECWAVTYVPEPEHYPFRLDGFQVLVSGDVEGVSQPFEVGVWTVDDDLMPVTQTVSVSAEFTAASDAFNGADFAVLDVDDIIIDEGNFAISMCLTDHMGFPAIATDVGGDLIEDRNWLFTGGAWGQSGGFGLTGNWIMRAIIEPQ